MDEQATYAATAGVRVKRPADTGRAGSRLAYLQGDRVIGGASLKGRGAVSNNAGRFERQHAQTESDGWSRDFPKAKSLQRAYRDVAGDVAKSKTELPTDFDPAEVLWPEQLKTTVQAEHPKSIITRNTSPDIPFDRSVNAYRGCEHGCVYCYARPAHAYMGLSPGLDFESKLFAKSNAAELLETEIGKPRYIVAPIAMGTNTDPYQPIEKTLKITRSLLEVCDKTNHPVTITTKSRSVVRDLDILSSMARRNLVHVNISVTTLDHKLSAIVEPRASAPQRRLDAIRLLSGAGIPTGVMVAPIIPAINDVEIERILEAVSHAGAVKAEWVLLRLPREVRYIFEAWLEAHFPDRKQKVMHHLMNMRNEPNADPRSSNSRVNDPRFGHRMRGVGIEVELLSKRFANAKKRFGLDKAIQSLDTDAFVKPERHRDQSEQLSLFS